MERAAKLSIERSIYALRAVIMLLAGCFALFLGPQAANAQTVNRYTNSTDSGTDAINDTATPCTNRFTRAFNVSTSFSVTDVNISVLMAHTWRADILMYLVSPGGTRVQLTTGLGGSSDNFNLTFDDEAGAAIAGYTANSSATAATSVPPYSASFRPSSVLSGFDGQNSAGNWILEICDNASQDSGTFFQADLYLTQAPSNFADLSLAKSVSSSTPSTGSTITYTLTAANAAGSPNSATGVVVRDQLPSGVQFVSSSGTGSYDNGTGNWSVGTLAPGQSASLTITATVTANVGTSVSNTAEVTASSIADSDSTVNNAVTSEDDYAAIAFTASSSRSAGTPPSFTCPAGTSLFDWDSNAWSAGSTSNTYNISGIGAISFGIVNPGSFLNNTSLGGQSPVTQTAVTGGLVPVQTSQIQLVDLANTSQTVRTTINLATPVPGARFTIFDVDYSSGQFADKVTVTGYRNGVAVAPTLTNGSANYVVGSTAYGDVTSGDTSGNANVIVTFNSPVDQIVIDYGNHSLAPSNPGQQAITLHDITFCSPATDISATKISTVLSDPVNGTTFPKAIPGAVIEYCIVVSNTGTTNATSVIAADTLPSGLTYTPGSLTTGTNCATATTAEDDNSTDPDESDPYGASVSGTSTITVTATASTLAGPATFAVKFRGTVN